MKPNRAISNADRYMLLANDAHAAADQMSDFASKNEMRQIARGYERLPFWPASA